MGNRKATPISADKVKQLFDYNEEEGKLYWKIAKYGVTRGAEAGCINAHGYLLVGIDNKLFRVHRVLYALYHCVDVPPTLHVDHIDGDRTNNRKNNLRLVTGQENQFNRPTAKGFSYYKKNKKFMARIKVNRKDIHLGYYDTELDARAAYLRAKEKYHVIKDRQE